MPQPRNNPPNRYIVYKLSQATDNYERLKHECLRGAEAATLLDKLRDLIEITGKEELEQTVTNYTQQMLLSAVRVSERQVGLKTRDGVRVCQNLFSSCYKTCPRMCSSTTALMANKCGCEPKI